MNLKDMKIGQTITAKRRAMSIDVKVLEDALDKYKVLDSVKKTIKEYKRYSQHGDSDILDVICDLIKRL